MPPAPRPTLFANFFCRFRMTQSKIISTDVMFAIIDAVNLGKDSHFPLEQGSQTQLTWGPLEVESGSGWAASSMPQKKVAQLTQSKLMIGL